MISSPTLDRLSQLETPVQTVGRVLSIRNGLIEVDGICPNIGDRCIVHSSLKHGGTADAEVISVSEKVVRATLTSGQRHIRRNDKVVCQVGGRDVQLNVDHILALDARGRAIAYRGEPVSIGSLAMFPRELVVAERANITRKIQTHENAIDDCLPLGFGQRVGVFAEAGAGKSMLLRKLLASVDCDHVVFALIGERSREVTEIIQYLKEAGLEHRVTLVVGLAGDVAPLRAQAMTTSLALAQHMAEAGKDVLHLVDSLTRFAYAIRELGLSSGEPMAQSGMTPSVYQRLPECLEMAGKWKNGGSVSTVAAVLLESQFDDPMSSYIRSLLDGHIYLDKALSDRGIFPSIDILRSRSRLDNALLDDGERVQATHIRSDLVDYQKIEEYLSFSGYERGSSPSIDQKILRHEQITSWMQGDLTTEALAR